MHLDGWTLLLQAVNFLVLVWLLRHFLYRPVLAVIAERQAATERVRGEADAARREAADGKRAVDAEKAGLAAERDRLLAGVRAQAAAERAALLDKARGEAEGLLAEGRARLAEERRQAEAGLRERAAALGTAVAARLLRVTAGDGMAEGFLEAACRSVEALPEPQRRALAGDGGDGGGDPVPVRLVTSAPLTVPEGERWQERLAAALGRPVAVAFAEDPGLIAGVELHFPHTVLRHSWKQALAAAMEELTRDDDNAARRA
ncbi:hypothetical protein [Azospirillum sp.]|uniref:F0F1 ATP synthase subunit B family protein n=1 Tax=Azospirillum sp. TaxID=34012 RepID=UPI002D636D1F|nr:hypothetical protein [Azospirillum sp.]HYD71411.1 hypothetical protein [Azospirillum sp.]